MEKKMHMKLAKLSTVTLALTMSVAGLAAPSLSFAKTNSTDVHTPSQVINMAKYTTPVTVTLGISNGGTITFLKGQNYDHNDVYNAYLKDMGIQLKNTWNVASSTYADKINLVIASGNLPDFMQVPSITQVQQLVNAGLVMDLTPYFQHDLSAASKPFFSNRQQMASVTFNGKVMAIPQTDSPYNSTNILYVRRDWLKKLNLPMPKTMQDVLADAAAFTKAHLGNGKVSYGLTATKDFLTNPAGGLQGFFNGYHAYPEIWLKKGPGLVYGSVQPEMKTALAQLQKMYQAGQIDQQFAAADSNVESQLIANNEVGMIYGYNWLPSWPLKGDILQGNKITQDWWPVVLPSVDSQPAKSDAPLGNDGYWVVAKTAQHPDAIFELLNKWSLIQPAPINSPYQVYLEGVTPKGVDNANDNYWQLNPITFYPPTQQNPMHVIQAMKTKDASKLTSYEQQIFQESEQYLSGKPTTGQYWNTYVKQGPGGTAQIMWDMMNKGQYQFDAFYGAPTPTMAKSWGNLESLLSEGFTQIIAGKQPVSYFDTLVKQWNSLGGQQITNEVDAWYAKASKEKVATY